MAFLLKIKRISGRIDDTAPPKVEYKLFDEEDEMDAYRKKIHRECEKGVLTDFYVMNVSDYGEAMSLMQALDEHFGMGLF